VKDVEEMGKLNVLIVKGMVSKEWINQNLIVHVVTEQGALNATTVMGEGQ
jgi:hypothetical protein